MAIDLEDFSIIFILGAITGIIFILSLFGIAGDHKDVIHTKEFGKKLCESKGFEYDFRTIDNFIPTIYCKENSTSYKQIYDGVVILKTTRN